MIPQHQLFGMWIQDHLLVYPVWHRMAPHVVPDRRQRHEQSTKPEPAESSLKETPARAGDLL